jgi:hypothetical protein
MELTIQNGYNFLHMSFLTFLKNILLILKPFAASY